MTLLLRRSSKPNHVDDAALEEQSAELNEESKELLSLYHKTFDDDKVFLLRAWETTLSRQMFFSKIPTNSPIYRLFI